MRLIAHIGTPKTGTTTIQSLLHMNREALDSQGFHFLQCAGPRNNRQLAACCVNDGRPDDFFRNRNILTPDQKASFRKEFRSKFESELSGLGRHIHSVIVSSEQLAERLKSKEEVARFHRLVAPWFSEYRIVCYLREQCDMAISHYSTALRSGGSRSFKDHLAECTPDEPRYNYEEMLQRWSEVFGRENIVARIFSRDAFVGDDLVCDFITCLSPGLLDAVDRDIESHNVSISVFGQRLLHVVNRSLNSRPGSRLRRRGKIRRGIMRVIDSLFQGPGLAPSRSEYEKIYRSFYDSNRRVSRTYFGKDEALFEFRPPL